MKTSVFIITGFLGAGKTTLLKRILESSADLSTTIVLINEFGKVGIDGSLIKNTATVDMVELSSGCICCSLRTDMMQALQTLSHKYSPERLVIETTGLADPLAIIEALDDTRLAPNFRLEKIITVIDSDFWEGRDIFGSFFKNQVKLADILLLNKVDKLDKSDVSVILKEIHEESTTSLVIPTLHCNIDPDIIWSRKKQKDQKLVYVPRLQGYNPETDCYSSINTDGTMTATAKEAGFISFSFETAKTMDKEMFMEFLKTIPLELFRIKGPVKFDHGTQMLNFVGGVSEWQKWSDNVTTCLALIGWDMMAEQMLEQLNNCIIKV